MQRAVAWFLDELPYGPASALLLLENVLIFALAVGGGALLVRLFRAHYVGPPPPPLERREWLVATGTVLLNTLVTIAGLWLYRRGIVRFRHDIGWRALLDVPILLLVMDSAMYVLHRVVHQEPFFTWFHALHHRYVIARPLTLFVLSPQETLAFGALWLAVIWIYPTSWLGMSIYLALNVVFGVLGHTGLKWVSSFHADHHTDPKRNFGFYTPLPDMLVDWLFSTR